MGWNDVAPRKECPLLAGMPAGAQFYFVHSYYVAPADDCVVAGETEYGTRFCSLIWRGEMYACQFHPEKSQAAGLRVLHNFVTRLPSVRQDV
jgi:glutamine amidotransferase